MGARGGRSPEEGHNTAAAPDPSNGFGFSGSPAEVQRSAYTTLMCFCSLCISHHMVGGRLLCADPPYLNNSMVHNVLSCVAVVLSCILYTFCWIMWLRSYVLCYFGIALLASYGCGGGFFVPTLLPYMDVSIFPLHALFDLSSFAVRGLAHCAYPPYIL